MAKQKVDILEVFEAGKRARGYVNISAPMVRYSKLEFRRLLRKYNVDLCYTPMIIADSFCRSDEARQNEFTTNLGDSPIIAQFAAKTAKDLLLAGELVEPFVDGIDVNCGCPQKWAISAGYGCALLKQPEIVRDMIRTIKRNLPQKFSCSLKLRILEKDIRTTVDLFRQLEHCGATYLSCHGRRPWQKTSEPVDLEAMAEIKKSLQIPFVVNGDVRSVEDAEMVHESTGCDGVMAARGLLTNPTMFTGTATTPLECVQKWVNIAGGKESKITFQCFHHHLTFMMEKMMKKRQRVEFNNFTKKSQVLEFLEENFGVIVTGSEHKNLICTYNGDLIKLSQLALESTPKSGYSSSQQSGKFFDEFKNEVYKTNSTTTDDLDDLNFMGGTIFDLVN